MQAASGVVDAHACGNENSGPRKNGEVGMTGSRRGRLTWMGILGILLLARAASAEQIVWWAPDWGAARATQLIKTFEAANPDITVKLEVTVADGLQNRIQIVLALRLAARHHRQQHAMGSAVRPSRQAARPRRFRARQYRPRRPAAGDGGISQARRQDVRSAVSGADARADLQQGTVPRGRSGS